MEELVEKELVRAIGISNFTITKTDNLLKTAKIPPAVNQGKREREKGEEEMFGERERGEKNRGEQRDKEMFRKR